MAAPDEDKAFIKSVADKVAEKKQNGENVSVTTDGAIVTKPKKVETLKPIEAPKPIETPKVVEKQEPIKASVPVAIEKDGQNLSITINLSINLNGGK